MSVEKALYTIMKNDSALQSSLGTDSNGSLKVYPNRADRKTQEPYAVYQVTSIDPTTVKDRTPPVDFIEMDIQLAAKKFSDVVAIADDLRNALERKKDDVEGVRIDRVNITNRVDRYDDEGQIHFREDTYEFRIVR